MEKLQGFTDHVMLYVKTLVKWLLSAALIGTVGGAVGSLFHLGVEYATELRTEVPALLYALPLAGVLIVALYRFLRTQGVGTNAVLDAVHQGRELPILLIPAIFLATLLTHLAGGSAGREGAALQIGGDLGEHFGKMLRMDDKDCRLATLCGMSALFSALFGTPLAAVFFALEVVSIGVLYYSGLIPCITSSLVAYAVSLRFGIEPMRFAVAAPDTGALTLARAAVLALGCALVSILFCRGLHITEHAAACWMKNGFVRAAVGGAVIVLATVLLGTTDYNGAGMDVIERAMTGQADSWAWLWKLAFTAVTIGCGFKGGEVVPSFFVGATFGCVFGGLLGLPPAFAAAVGLVAVFCGAVNCPIASVILSVELFGAGGMAYFAAACAISYLLSGYCGLYSSQTILYSKLKAEFINVHTHE